MRVEVSRVQFILGMLPYILCIYAYTYLCVSIKTCTYIHITMHIYIYIMYLHVSCISVMYFPPKNYVHDSPNAFDDNDESQERCADLEDVPSRGDGAKLRKLCRLSQRSWGPSVVIEGLSKFGDLHLHPDEWMSVYVGMHAGMHACMFVCTYVCMHLRLCISKRQITWPAQRSISYAV